MCRCCITFLYFSSSCSSLPSLAAALLSRELGSSLWALLAPLCKVVAVGALRVYFSSGIVLTLNHRRFALPVFFLSAVSVGFYPLSLSLLASFFILIFLLSPNSKRALPPSFSCCLQQSSMGSPSGLGLGLSCPSCVVCPLTFFHLCQTQKKSSSAAVAFSVVALAVLAAGAFTFQWFVA